MGRLTSDDWTAAVHNAERDTINDKNERWNECDGSATVKYDDDFTLEQQFRNGLVVTVACV